MNHELLTVLIAAAESKNFREAAARLQISQPAVSLKLQELERLQPIPLFQLEGKRKVLTHFGRALYQLAKRDLGALETHVENLHRLYGNPRNLVIRIGGRPDLLDYLAPLLDFEGRIDFVALSSAKSVEKLLAHEVDIAISYTKPDSTEVTAKALLSSKPLFVVHSSLLKGKRLTLDLAGNRDFLLSLPSVLYNPAGHLLKEWVEQHGLTVEKLRASFVIDDWRAIQSLVEKGLGYAIVPSYVPISSEVQKIEVRGNGLSPYTFHALFENGLRKIPAFQKLLAFGKAPLQRMKG